VARSRPESPAHRAATANRTVGALDLSDPETVRTLAHRSGLFAKRRLSQHFLVDRSAIVAIADALAATPSDTVWEIGPGMGALTAELAHRAARIVAVELDPACLRAARRALAGLGNVELVEADALSVDAGRLGLPEAYLAAGNLPYNLTGALLSHLFEAPRPPRRAVFLVQREVAARLAAPPGGWSLATVAIRSVAAVERLRDLRPESFLPAPAVASSVIRMEPRRCLDETDRARVLRVARAAFQLRRKTLRHGLARAVGGDTALAVELLEACGVNPERRPETLDLDEWRCLATAAARRFPIDGERGER
jgi:16S rRNA (adenine1518-N6/adenine1519-N6)-dimethyltransferase